MVAQAVETTSEHVTSEEWENRSPMPASAAPYRPTSPELIADNEPTTTLLQKKIHAIPDEIQVYHPKKRRALISLKQKQNEEFLKLNQERERDPSLEVGSTVKILPKKQCVTENNKNAVNQIIGLENTAEGLNSAERVQNQNNNLKRKRSLEQLQDELKQQKAKQLVSEQLSASQETSDKRDRDESSEGATTLLMLANAEHQRSDDFAEECPEIYSISSKECGEEAANQNATKYPNGIWSNEESENFVQFSSYVVNPTSQENEEEILCVDEEDKDDGLVIIESDEKTTIYESLQEVEEASLKVDTTTDETEMKEGDEGRPRSNSRTASKRKMEDGKHWLINTLMVVGGSMSVIKLSDIEKSYLSYCEEQKKEPLSTPVLARLIHGLFPSAEKCRLGARRNQRIHYRSLAFKSDVQNKSSHTFEPIKQNEYQQHKIANHESNNTKQIKLSENQTAPKGIIKGGNPTEQAESNQSKNIGTGLIYYISDDEPPQKKQAQSPHQDDEESCKAAAKKLQDVLKWITNQGESHKRALLRDFAHSASCQRATCVPVCLMFRRVRRHVVAAQHSCSVLRLYSLLLRHHVSSCTSMKCGLPACPALRATRIQKPQGVGKQGAVLQGQAARYRPSSLVLAPQSPRGSLPSSPENSPPSSPDSDLLSSEAITAWPEGPGQVQYVLVPVMSFVKNPSA